MSVCTFVLVPLLCTCSPDLQYQLDSRLVLWLRGNQLTTDGARWPDHRAGAFHSGTDAISCTGTATTTDGVEFADGRFVSFVTVDELHSVLFMCGLL